MNNLEQKIDAALEALHRQVKFESTSSVILTLKELKQPWLKSQQNYLLNRLEEGRRFAEVFHQSIAVRTVTDTERAVKVLIFTLSSSEILGFNPSSPTAKLLQNLSSVEGFNAIVDIEYVVLKNGA